MWDSLKEAIYILAAITTLIVNIKLIADSFKKK